MNRSGQIAVAFAAIGVAIQTAALGRVPAISLSLAVTFCIYGSCASRRKPTPRPAFSSNAPISRSPALIYVLHLQATGAGHFGDGAPVTLLLIAAGPVTVVPLALFAWSARRLPLSAVGFLQFLSPTLQFLLGIAFGEAFTPTRALSFAFIWLGVGRVRLRRLAPDAHSGGGLRRAKKGRSQAPSRRHPLRCP